MQSSQDLLEIYNKEIKHNDDILPEMKNAIHSIITNYSRCEDNETYFIIKELHNDITGYLGYSLPLKKRIVQRFLMDETDKEYSKLNSFILQLRDFTNLINKQYMEKNLDNMYKLSLLPKIVNAIKSPNNDAVNSLLDTHSFLNLTLDSFRLFFEETNANISAIIESICDIFDDIYGAKLSIQEILENEENKQHD